jgi:hypothetical protein
VLPQLQTTVPDFQDWRNQTHSFSQPEVVQATSATSDFFSTMGIQPLLGRGLSDDDERAKRPVALIAEKLWRRKFAALYGGSGICDDSGLSHGCGVVFKLTP